MRAFYLLVFKKQSLSFLARETNERAEGSPSLVLTKIIKMTNKLPFDEIKPLKKISPFRYAPVEMTIR